MIAAMQMREPRQRDRAGRLSRLLGLGLLLLPVAALAGPPFITDDPEPVDDGHYEINIAATGLVQKGVVASPVPMVDANWGAAPDLQLHAGVGIAYSATGDGVEAGYGDTELGVKYRFIHQDDAGWRLEVALYPIVELPTGDAARGLGAGHAQVLLPIWIEKDWGQWTSYGGGGFEQNRDAGTRNFWFVGWVLLRKVSDDLQLGGEIYRQTSTAEDLPGTTAVNLGGTWDLSDTGHVLFSFGRGLAHAGTVDRFSFYLGWQITG
jgi:hypothetical protein